MKTILMTCAAMALCPVLANPAFADQPVTINFAAEVAGQPFACAGSYPDLGSSAAEMRFSDFRLFVTAPAMVRADGSLQPITLDQDGAWQVGDVALLDFEDGTGSCSGTGNAGLNTALRGSVPEGDYAGLAFTIGVPFAQNHGDPTLAAAPLNTTGMFWSWRGGFRFVRIDMVPAGGMPAMPKADAVAQGASGHGNATGWFLHLGSTGCVADSGTQPPTSCTNPNHVPVVLPDFDPSSNVVVLDPAPVVAGADLLVNAPETSPGCMAFSGDADCNSVMPKLGLAYDGIAAGSQQLVSWR